MKDVFRYAKNEALGLQFEPFTYRANGMSYVWNVSPLMVWVCQWLVAYAEPLAEILFNRLLKVDVQ